GEGLAGSNVRAVLRDGTGVWAATESRIFVDSAATGEYRDAEIRIPGLQGLPGAPRAFLPTLRPELPPTLPGRAGTLPPPALPPSIATPYGMVGRLNQGECRIYYLGAADRFRPAGDIWAFTWWGPPYRPLAGSAAGVNRFLAGDLPFDDLFLSEAAAQPAEPR